MRSAMSRRILFRTAPRLLLPLAWVVVVVVVLPPAVDLCEAEVVAVSLLLLRCCEELCTLLGMTKCLLPTI